MARVPHRACGTAGAPDLILVGQAEPALPKVWPLHRAPPPFVSGLLRRLCRVVLKPQLPRLRSPPRLRHGGGSGSHFGRAGGARPPQGLAASRPDACDAAPAAGAPCAPSLTPSAPPLPRRSRSAASWPVPRRRKVRSAPFPPAVKTPPAPLLLLSPRNPFHWAFAGCFWFSASSFSIRSFLACSR